MGEKELKSILITLSSTKRGPLGTDVKQEDSAGTIKPGSLYQSEVWISAYLCHWGAIGRLRKAT